MTKINYIRRTWRNGEHFGFSRAYRVKQIVLGWFTEVNILTEI